MLREVDVYYGFFAKKATQERCSRKRIRRADITYPKEKDSCQNSRPVPSPEPGASFLVEKPFSWNTHLSMDLLLASIFTGAAKIRLGSPLHPIIRPLAWAQATFAVASLLVTIM